jgi:hypothetical protein
MFRATLVAPADLTLNLFQGPALHPRGGSSLDAETKFSMTKEAPA